MYIANPIEGKHRGSILHHRSRGFDGELISRRAALVGIDGRIVNVEGSGNSNTPLHNVDQNQGQ